MALSVSRSARLLVVLVLVTLWAASARAQSAASQYVGRPIEDIRLFVENRPTTEAAVVDLIAVKTGEPLSIAAVRESIAHIYSLGRFQDVQVEGAQAPGGGVALRFNLIPFHSIQRIDFTGTLGLSSGELRSAVVDRYGASPPIGRVDAAVRTLQQLYADRGYLRAKIEASSQILHDPDRALLTFTIDAGPRATIGRVVFERDPSVSREEFLRRIGAVTGEVFLRPRLQERLDDYVRRLKERRFYEAEGSFQAVESEDGRTVDLVDRYPLRPAGERALRLSGGRSGACGSSQGARADRTGRARSTRICSRTPKRGSRAIFASRATGRPKSPCAGSRRIRRWPSCSR